MSNVVSLLPVVERSANPRHQYVCGDCAARLFEAGGVRDKSVEFIGYGTACELHEALFSGNHGPHASSVVLMPEGWVPPEVVETVSESRAIELDACPREVGPVTRMTLTLVSAWTRDEKYADNMTIANAVDAARRIITATKGR